MKDKILILLYTFLPYSNANVNVMLPIIEKLGTKYDITVLCCDINKNNKKSEIIKVGKCDVNVYRYKENTNFIYKFSKVRLENVDSWAELILRKMTKTFGCLLFDVVYGKNIKILDEESAILKKKIYRATEKLVKKNGFKCIVSCTSPFSPQNIILKLYKENVLCHDSTKWLAYFTDPYAEYIGNVKRREELLDVEYEVYKEADRIIVTPEMYENDNTKNRLNEFLYKTEAIPLANLSFSNTSKYRKKGYADGNIHFLFAGSLQDTKVRNPTYFFHIVNHIANDFNNCIFHMLIYSMDKETQRIRDSILKDSRNILWEYRRSLDYCREMMDKCDILVNIGNSCINQVPSKIFDYITTMKPIINFIENDKDTSKKYLDCYPLGLNIENKYSSKIDYRDIGAIFGLYEKSKKVNISKDDVICNYRGYTKGDVKERVLKLVDDLCSNIH